MQQGILKYLILDDEELARFAVENEADKFSFLKKIASCAHPVEALELINRFSPDVIFLDIEMPLMSGMELIRKKMMDTVLPVLITSHPDYAIESYELNAFDYLLKPFTAERFARCAYRLYNFFQLRTKAFAFDNEQAAGYIFIKQGHEKVKLPVKDILYLEAMKDYTCIKTVSKRYLVLTTLKAILHKLPDDVFVQIHRSYIVNYTKVTAVDKNQVAIQSETFPVGKLYKAALKLYFN